MRATTGVAGVSSASVSAVRCDTSYFGSTAFQSPPFIGSVFAPPVSKGKQSSGGPANTGAAMASEAATRSRSARNVWTS